MLKLADKGMIRYQLYKIINTYSMMSELSSDKVSAYAFAKEGLKMLIRSLATERSKYNVKINAIGPNYYPLKIMINLM